MTYPFHGTDAYGEPVTVINQAHHRNGVGGAPFVASTIEWDVMKGDKNRFVAVTFYGEDELDPMSTAVLNLSILPVIEFGRNSWRGDAVGQVIVDAWIENRGY